MKTKTEKEFELRLEKLKKETHEKFKEFFDEYVNVKNWRIDFNYDWSINCSSWIDEDINGWYDKLIEEEFVEESNKEEVKEE